MQSGYFQLDQTEMPALNARFFKQKICVFKGEGFPALFAIFDLKWER